eukprot:902501-Pelagomonas_calceolata.AAC.4
MSTRHLPTLLQGLFPSLAVEFPQNPHHEHIHTAGPAALISYGTLCQHGLGFKMNLALYFPQHPCCRMGCPQTLQYMFANTATMQLQH